MPACAGMTNYDTVSLIKVGQGGFSWFAGDEPVMENLFRPAFGGIRYSDFGLSIRLFALVGPG